MKRLAAIFLAITVSVLATEASTDTVGVVCAIVKMQVDRLPDMRLPRMGHALMCVGDQLIAFGGHTDGFVPTPTAERLTAGGWQVMDMVYAHDNGAAIKLSSGRVMLAGGVEKEMGIGQTYGVELYDPEAHTFKGVGSMDQKRAFASAVELQGGRVVIVGNWYNNDYIECFDGKSHCDSVRPVSVPRARPWVLPMAHDDAMVFGSRDAHGNIGDCTMVDWIKGETRQVQLLEYWHTMMFAGQDTGGDCCAIGSESNGEYAYLIPVHNDVRQMALMKVKNAEFSLLRTECPLPMRSPWADINYFGFVVDRKEQRAYLVGAGQDCRLYVAAVDYAKAEQEQGATVTLYYSDPIGCYISDSHVALMPDGNPVVAGGIGLSNFEPLAQVLKLKVAPDSKAASPWQGMFWVAMIAIAALIAVVIWGGKRSEWDERAEQDVRLDDESRKRLFGRIAGLMDDQQVYLQSQLRLADMAAMLGVTQLQMTRCVKQETGEAFTMFANRYRIDHAKRIMQASPDTKLTAVALASGFTNEKSFFRVFKAITGLTPKEWLTSRQ